MQAVTVSAFGGLDALEVIDIPVPEPGPGQVRIRGKGLPGYRLWRLLASTRLGVVRRCAQTLHTRGTPLPGDELAPGSAETGAAELSLW